MSVCLRGDQFQLAIRPMLTIEHKIIDKCHPLDVNKEYYNWAKNMTRLQYQLSYIFYKAKMPTLKKKASQ